MIAKIKLTVAGKTYNPGEKITGKLNKADEVFLRREGYIEDEKSSKEPTVSKNTKDENQIKTWWNQ